MTTTTTPCPTCDGRSRHKRHCPKYRGSHPERRPKPRGLGAARPSKKKKKPPARGHHGVGKRTTLRDITEVAGGDHARLPKNVDLPTPTEMNDARATAKDLLEKLEAIQRKLASSTTVVRELAKVL